MGTSVVEVWCTLSLRHVLVIKGRVILTGQDFIIANIYAPCDVMAKKLFGFGFQNLSLILVTLIYVFVGISIRLERHMKGEVEVRFSGREIQTALTTSLRAVL